MKTWKNLGLILGVILVIGVASLTRWKALTTLNIDYDEDDYMRAAQEFTAIYRSGDLKDILNTNYRPEHPPFAKMVLGLALLGDPAKDPVPDRPTSAQPNNYLPRNLLRSDRLMNAAFGVVTAGLLAIINPFAGFLLAIHSWTIKYVSQIMLEAIPAFTSLICIMAYARWRKKKSEKLNTWLIISAIFLGISVASKYLYAVVGVAILVDWIIETTGTGEWKRAIRNALIWGVIAVVIFFLFDPYLWPDPIGRLKESILFHTVYSQTAEEVKSANLPAWQQLIWLSGSPRVWQDNAFYFSIDPIIALFAGLGYFQAWKKHRIYAVWLLVAIIFLLAWPTKWPQYLLTLSVPLCLCAAEGFNQVIFAPFLAWLKQIFTRKKTAGVPRKSELKAALPWLLPGGIIFLIFTLGPLLYQIGVSLTDFNTISIKDGLSGGIWREVWGGLSGQIQAATQNIPYRSKEVHYLGLMNFKPVMDIITNQQVLFNNIFWTVSSVGLQTLLGMAVALVLWQRGIKFKKGWQTLFILPWAIPEMIGALMWTNVFAPDTGWLALAQQQFGSGMPFGFLLNWTNDPNLLFGVLLISGVWYGFPFMMLAATAGLRMLPMECYDSALIDGASGFQLLKFVTWPLIYPLIIPAIIIRGIFAFNQFYLFQSFQIPTITLATLSYNFFNPTGFFNNGQFAVSAVINVITILILMAFVVLFNHWSHASRGVDYA